MTLYFSISKILVFKFRVLFIYLIEDFFCVYIALSKHEGIWENSTVMQTRDAVEGLHNFREFSQPPSIAFIKYFSKSLPWEAKSMTLQPCLHTLI